jgi:thioesterase domain-containing protein
VIGFAELGAALAPDVSLVGVQAIGTDGAHAPDVTVQAMAKRYADAIADHQRPVNGGHVWIGGYSDGGVIALHTAALLVEKGLQVRPVLLLDAFLGTEIPRGLSGRIGVVTDNLSDHPGRSIVGHAADGWRGWRVRHTTLQRDHDLAERMAELGHRDLFDVVLRACRDAGERPLGHRLSVSLIRCREYNPFERHNFGWIAKVADILSISWTSGHHLSMLRGGHATDLAAAIRAVRTPDSG